MKRSLHNLSHRRPMSFDQGQIVPCACVEVLAGDTFQAHTSALIRTNPLLAPLMHKVETKIHHWFVPNRLIWQDWESFITGGEDGLDDSEYPTITLTPAVKSLADYLGLPTGNELTVSALPFRAYNFIYNTRYRDQQLQSEVAMSTESGADTTTATDLLRCNWDKDYFTSARPDEQLGVSVTLPIGTTAPINATGPLRLERISDNVQGTLYGDNAYSQSLGFSVDGGGGVSGYSTMEYLDGLQTDLSTASGATINQLREAFALQKFAEMRNLYGGRYEEYLMALGVNPRDGRLSRPEYLGGGKQVLQFSEIIQTAPNTDATTDEGVASLKGHGIGAMQSNKYRQFFPEHGYVLSFIILKPENMYMNGLHRSWSRRSKEDYWQKELEIMGQQEIKNKEIYAPHTTPDGIFGYQNRYDEYRRIPSTVHGEYRSILKFWHMAREFTGDVALNSSFIECNPTDRIYATTEENEIQCYIHNKIAARRLVRKTAKMATLA